ncbi:unnamed protein product [Ixodes persulcatus]
MCCGIVSRDDAGVKLFALSVLTSQVKAKPHTIDVNLSEKINAKCSCKAGLSGTCKHAVAALLFINRTGIDNLEELSSTDLTQCWGRHQTAKLYEPRKLSELCHVKHQKQPSLPNDLLEEVRLELINAAPQSALALHIRGRAIENCETAPVITDKKMIDLYDHITPCSGVVDYMEMKCFYKVTVSDSKIRLVAFSMDSLTPEQRLFFDTHIAVTKEAAIQLCQVTVLQNNTRWLSERRLRITGSICRGLFTFEPLDEAEWKFKIENLLSGRKFKGNKATAYGKASEPAALEMYEARTGNAPERFGLVVNPSIPWLGYSPDGVVMKDGTPLILIEIKSPIRGKTVSIRRLVKKKKIPYLVMRGKKLALKENHSYYSQCQLGLLLLNLKVCDLIVFSKVRSAVIRIERNESHITNLVRKLHYVYFKHMLPRLCEMNDRH